MEINRKYRIIVSAMVLSLFLSTGESKAVRNVDLYAKKIGETIPKSFIRTVMNFKDEEDLKLKESILLSEKDSDYTPIIVNNKTNDNKKENNKTISNTEKKDKPIIKYSESEYDLFCRLIMGECGGESYQCQLATASVVINRVRSSRFPDTLKGVIKQKGQFSGRTDKKPTESIKKACWEAICGNGNVPSSVLYFRASKSKKWGSHTFYRRIGGHSFYKQ